MKPEDLIVIREVLEKEITNLDTLNTSDVNTIRALECKLNCEKNVSPRCREYVEERIRSYNDLLEARRNRLRVVENTLASVLKEDTNEIRI